jgi:CDP-diacylglycerol--serine O-phosphatidyltransferase
MGGWLSLCGRGAVRLARFNIQSGSQDKRYFVGMPSPAAACIPAATVFAYPQGFQSATHAVAVLADGDHPGTDDGQHDSLPELQDVRPAGAAQFCGPRPPSPLVWYCSRRSRSTCWSQWRYTYLASGFIGYALTRLHRRQGGEEKEEEVRLKPDTTQRGA